MSRRFLLFGTLPYAYEILRPLQAAARERGDEVAWYLEPGAGKFLLPGEQRLDTVHDVVAWQPDAVFVPGNWVPDFFPGVKVQVFHGFGIEKKGHFRIRGWFDLYCTHGPLTTQPFQAMAAADGSFAVRETGWPKMDALFASRAEPGLQEVFSNPEKPIILYAPTFSKSLTSVPDLAGRIFALSEEGPWNWLVKFHPKMDPAWVDRFRAASNGQLQVSMDANIASLLHTADAMLTDTSSVAAEFLLLDKAVATFRNASPGPHYLDFNEPGQLERIVHRALAPDDDHRLAMRKYADNMHPFRDTKSSQRVIEATCKFIDQGTAERLQPKPLNLWRRLRMRLKAGYFRF
ncbi:MAG: CDP-glycerol glycerophosphotransferase family protein [Gammaproteobacteria bacterium]|nr:CDP-glycerol glycerophosphotransferase family protein [Gammaproteobacteria bacterium]